MALCDLQTFIDCLEDTVVVIDEDFRVLLANTATLRTFGWKAEEVVDQPCYVTFHDQTAPCDSGPSGLCAVQTARATGKPARVRHRHPDAGGFVHTVEIFASPLPTREDGSTLVVELMREITHQAELEDETALPPAAVKALADEVLQRGALALNDTVQVCDDGVGFDVAEKLGPARRQPAFGLLGMQERLETVNGRLHIQSAPNQGTRLRIFVPCETGRTRT
jgi:PAS domain S-box-containing protein